MQRFLGSPLAWSSNNSNVNRHCFCLKTLHLKWVWNATTFKKSKYLHITKVELYICLQIVETCYIYAKRVRYCIKMSAVGYCSLCSIAEKGTQYYIHTRVRVCKCGVRMTNGRTTEVGIRFIMRTLFRSLAQVQLIHIM